MRRGQWGRTSVLVEARSKRRAWIGVLRWALAAWLCAAAAWAETPPPPGADVTLRDAVVLRVHRGDGVQTLEQRAQRASRALAEIVDSATPEQVEVRPRGERTTIVVGATPILELTTEDAALAGDASLEVHAESAAARLRAALKRERQRSRIANTVFSASLVVFFGLVTLYLMRKLHDFSTRSRRVLVATPDRVPALRLKRLEVLGPAAVRSVLLLLVSLGHGIGLFGLAYTWLVLSLSLFVGTRPHVERLTGLVLEPLSSMVARVAAALPLFVVVIIAGGLTAVIVRITELFFASVGRGETRLAWLAPELAQAMSTVARAGIVVFAMVYAGPVITGDPNGAISRTGTIVLMALALASTPVLVSIVAGVALAFSRSVQLGDDVEYGGCAGRVRDIGIVVMTLDSEDGGTVRVPHARSLWHPTRILGRAPR